jgi:hypothetical protein
VVARIREIDKWGIAWEAELPEHGVVPVSVAAKLFGVSVMTVHNWIATPGLLTTTSRHGVVAIPVQSLIKLAVDRGDLPDEEEQFPHY